MFILDTACGRTMWLSRHYQIKPFFFNWWWNSCESCFSSSLFSCRLLVLNVAIVFL